MYTSEVLLDIHDRAHRSFRKLLQHCAQLSPDSLNRELPGFGYPTVRLQLHHVIGAEEYWFGVLQGSFRVEDDDADFPTIASLEEYRERVARITEQYLRHASDSELNTPREMKTFHGERVLVPARISVRNSTHIFQHQGQVLAQCRLLDRPGPAGLDFPLD